MENISRLTRKFIKITNALKHADDPRQYALYKSMLTADELETLNYVSLIMNCCEAVAGASPQGAMCPASLSVGQCAAPPRSTQLQTASSSAELQPLVGIVPEKKKRGRKKKEVVDPRGAACPAEGDAICGDVSSSSCEEMKVDTPPILIVSPENSS